MREIWAIAKQELRHSLRDRSFLGLAVVFLLLFLVATGVSIRASERGRQEMQVLQNTVQQHWLEQPDRHPHRVAHYGYLAFRPRPELGFFDFGVSDFTGNSIFLEAHVQNSANFSEARQDSSMLRFGALTPAFVAQSLVPLLIIFLLGPSITRERESGTLAQVFSLGLGWRKFLLGKALGGLLVFGLLLGPVYCGATLIAAQATGSLGGDTLFRIGLLFLYYSLYLTVWILLSLLVSVYSKSSGRSTVILLALWIAVTTFLPKSLPSLGAYLFPGPSRPEFEHRLHLEVAGGGDGHNPAARQFAQKKEELLKKHGVESIKDLPMNWKGMAMTQGEKASSKVYQKHYGQLQETYAQQNQVSQWGSVLSPYLAVQQLSASLCGTDFSAAVRFEQEAEKYRYDLIQRLNGLHTHEIKYEKDRAQRVDAQHWAEFEPFDYQRPSVWEDARRTSLLSFILLGQLFLLSAFLLKAKGPVR